MEQKKVITTGMEDFQEIIISNRYYVDKTGFIKDLIDHKDKVNLFTRPRRFGKTLNMSMLKYFFEDTAEDYSHLFKGLKIASYGDTYMQEQGKYPVISLSLKGMNQPSYIEAYHKFMRIISDECKRLDRIIDHERMSKDQRTEWDLLLHREADFESYTNALKFICSCLYDVMGKKPIILIDEYDVPLSSARYGGYYDEMVDLIRSVFESALKTNDSLEFAVLTGCLRVSKESIFTGLNNLKIYDVFSNRFSEYYGFTDQEVKELLTYYGFNQYYDEIKDWYDGYRFGRTEIYNPWSILNCVDSLLQDNDDCFQAYWTNTSSNNIIKELIEHSERIVRDEIETLIQGGSLKKAIVLNLTYRDIDVKSSAIWSYLAATGYLKSIGTEKIEDETIYELVIPNKEIRLIYKNEIRNWFTKQMENHQKTELLQALVNGDSEKAERILGTWLYDTISYYDTQENFYHGFMTGVLMGLPDEYKVESNRESGNGRPDILISQEPFHDIGIIMEFKYARKKSDLENACAEALQQIEDQCYDAELNKDSYAKILKYGIAFYGKYIKLKLK